MPSAPLERLISERYPSPQWATVHELRQGTGYGKGREGRIDAAAFNCWPSKGNLRLAFECKRTRADFRRELENPAKRKWVEDQFHQTYFVCLPGIVEKDEVPDGWGLLIATKGGDKLIQRKMARHRDAPVLSESLAVSAVRALAGQLDRALSTIYTLGGNEVSEDRIVEIVAERTTHEREKLRKRRDKLREQEFELQDARSKLTAPLRELLRHTGRSQFRASAEEAMTLTVQDVERLVAEIRVSIIRQLKKPVSALNINLTWLLNEMDGVDKP